MSKSSSDGSPRPAAENAPGLPEAGAPAAPTQGANSGATAQMEALLPSWARAGAFLKAVELLQARAAAPRPPLMGDAEAKVALRPMGAPAPSPTGQAPMGQGLNGQGRTTPMSDDQTTPPNASNPSGAPGATPDASAIKPENAAQQKRTVSHALGEITWLMTQSSAHKHLLLSDLEWFVMPAILLEQFRIYYAPVPGKAGEQGATQPAGCAIWARVSDEVEARLKEAGANARLKLQDWRSGNKPYLIEIIAPFGGIDEMKAEWEKVIVGSKGQ